MAQKKILLDSNVYLRLAFNIHPLLFVSFGKDNFTLYVINDFEKEFEKSNRLKTKFTWVNEKEYKENRKKRITLSKKNKTDIKNAYTVIWDYNITGKYGASRVDVYALSYGYVLKTPIVTDDKDMLNLGKEFDIEVWGVLKLLKLMLDCERITLVDTKALIEYLEYDNDLPYKNFKKDAKKVFFKNIDN